MREKPTPCVKVIDFWGSIQAWNNFTGYFLVIVLLKQNMDHVMVYLCVVSIVLFHFFPLDFLFNHAWDFIPIGIVCGTGICPVQIPTMRRDRDPEQLSLMYRTRTGICFCLFPSLRLGREVPFSQKWDGTGSPAESWFGLVLLFITCL